MSDSLQPHGLQSTRLYCPLDFPGKNTRVRCHFLLQGIFLTLGLNPCLLSSALAGSFFTTEPPRKPKIKLGTNLKCWQGCWETGSLVYCWWEWKMFSHSGKQSGGFLWNKTCNYHMTQKLCCSASERLKFMCSPKPLYHVHRSFIHSSQTVGASQRLLRG